MGSRSSSILVLLVIACGSAPGGSGGTDPTTTMTTTPASSSGAATDATQTTSGSVDTSTSAAAESEASTSPPDDDTSSESGDPTGGVQRCAGTWPDAWIDGTSCGKEPTIQIHAYDANTVILRQSLCTNFEAPFIYLLFGQDRVLMQDTGAGGIAIATTVNGVIADWLAANGKDSIELVVSNSHAHGDHVAGNGQFTGQPNTTMVGTSAASISAFFGIANWPNETASYDLGGRQIDVIPIPGHEPNHIALYDHATGWLMTGDTLYPGRLYIPNAAFSQYVASIERLVDFTATLDVCHVMGTHIEMTTTPMVDFQFGATQHPNEHPLPLTRDHLVELRDAVLAMGNTPVYEEHADFIIYPL